MQKRSSKLSCLGLFGAIAANACLVSSAPALAAPELSPSLSCRSEGLDRLGNKLEFVLKAPLNPNGSVDVRKPVLDLRVTKVGDTSPQLVLNNFPLTFRAGFNQFFYVGEFFEGLEVIFDLDFNASFRYRYTVVSNDPNVENRLIVSKEDYSSGAVACTRN
jgi:hypothetical protein